MWRENGKEIKRRLKRGIRKSMSEKNVGSVLYLVGMYLLLFMFTVRDAVFHDFRQIHRFVLYRVHIGAQWWTDSRTLQTTNPLFVKLIASSMQIRLKRLIISICSNMSLGYLQAVRNRFAYRANFQRTLDEGKRKVHSGTMILCL